MIPYSADFEGQIVDAVGTDKDAREAHAIEMGRPSMISKITNVGYRALRLIHFFTAGKDEVKCWTIRDGWKAPQAAGTIHGDFERGFICAEIMKYTDLAEAGNEQDVKANGLYKQEGKNYEMKDGDIVNFKFNVTAAKKKVDKAEGK